MMKGMMRGITRSKLIASASLLFLCAASSAYAVNLDGDGKDDLTVFRPITGTNISKTLFVSSQGNYSVERIWGDEKDFPVPGKYTSTTGADIATWRPSDGVWYLRHFSADLEFDTASSYQWGKRGDKPHPCDFTGDGLNEMTFVRTSKSGRKQLTWFSRNSSAFSTANSQRWGKKGDVPIPYDYDNDGKCDYAVYRNGEWFVILSSTNGAIASTIEWGAKGDVPVPGSYTADSVPDFAVYRNRRQNRGGPLWIIRKSDDGGLTSRVIQWGQYRDLPVPADYDGDGKTDIAVFRPSNFTWYILNSSTDYDTATATQFGQGGDIAIGERRVKDPS